MEYKPTHHTTFNRVISTYEGRTAMSNSMREASFIIKYMHEDTPGTHLISKFQYQVDLDDFWNRIKHTKSFKISPADFKTPDGRNIQCRYNIDHPDCPIAIAQISEDTVDAYRVSMEEVILSMSYKSILLNESFNDMFNLRGYPLYNLRLQQLSLIDTIYKIIESKDPEYIRDDTSKKDSTEDIKVEGAEVIDKETEEIDTPSDSSSEEDNEYKWGVDPELDEIILRIYGKDFTLDDIRPETW